LTGDNSSIGDDGQIQDTLSIELFTNRGIRLGTFSGPRTQLSAECVDASTGIPDLAEINILYSLAEQRLPDLFPGGPQTYNQKIAGYIQRYYEESGISVRVRNRTVELKGSEFGPDWLVAGQLDTLIGKLQSRVMPVTIPAELTGTYVLSFAPAGEFSPIQADSSLDFAITGSGTLCLEGQVASAPFLNLDNPTMATWQDSETGLVYKVDLSVVTGTALTIDVEGLDGQVLGTMSGARTGLLATCAGLVADNLDIASIVALFTLLEQNERAIFPPSALTYNQLTGSTLVRYYPDTGVLVNINGDTVSASGGVFGPLPQVYGSVSALLAQQQALVDPVPTVSLAVAGNMVYQIGNVPSINRNFSVSRQGLSMPDSTEDAALISLVEQALGSEVSGSSLYTFSNVAESSDALSFEVFISNESSVATRLVKRSYSLRFTYTRNPA
jgi:hypothetical protein